MGLSLLRLLRPIVLASVAAVLLAVARVAESGAAEPASAERTNFVIVLADDLGYGDLGCYGNRDVRTPNIDRFAAEGIRFTDCYAAAANCSPARAGLLTGGTPYRVGIYNWIPYGSPMHLRRSEITIATLLKRAGYATCHVGKWHLNGGLELKGQPQPSDHGFDYWFSTQNNALPCHRNPDNFVRNGQPVGPLKGFSGQIVVGEAIRWLRSVRSTGKPFFLFVCLHEPHEPIATDHRFAKLYPPIGKPSPFDPAVTTYQAHHGNITQMDAAFGRLMTALDELGLRDSTFVFLTSDNGPAITRWHPHGSAGPLRDKKGSLYEGGIRVPGIVRWPGKARPGTTSHEPICGVDLLPTVCEIAGIKPPADRALDGASILPVLSGKPIKRSTPLYWQFNYARSKPKVAIRVGKWKLLAELEPAAKKPLIDITPQAMHLLKTARLARLELYDLSRDVSESNDLSAAKPERLKSLARLLKAKYKQVVAEGPTWPAWKWPHYEGQRIREFRRSLLKKFDRH